MNTEFGTVEYGGREYELTGQALADNYGTEGEVRYYANAIGPGGNSYRVAWETTERWNLSQERETLRADSFLSDDEKERLAELEMLVLPDVSDESNACEWDSPVRVTL